MILCDYCGGEAKLVTGADVWPHRKDLVDKKVWQCVPCGAHVGCHQGTEIPLGRLANEELRAAKMLAHSHFDKFWKSSKGKKRARVAAYAWLAERMGLDSQECHIGMFDVEQCLRAVDICKQEWERLHGQVRQSNQHLAQQGQEGGQAS